METNPNIQIPSDQPPVQLTGLDGNSFVILGACQRAARRAGWSKEEVEAWRTLAVDGDYDHLLGTAMRYFDVS